MRPSKRGLPNENDGPEASAGSPPSAWRAPWAPWRWRAARLRRWQTRTPRAARTSARRMWIRRSAPGSRCDGAPLGGGTGGTAARRTDAELYAYLDAIVNDTIGNPRVKVVKRSAGTTELGRDIPYVVVGTPENIDNLDTGRTTPPSGAASVRAASPRQARARGRRHAPGVRLGHGHAHGNEPAAGEAIMRLLYELARAQGLRQRAPPENLDIFIDAARNPDGRDQSRSASAYAVGLRPQPRLRHAHPAREPPRSCRTSRATRACSSSTPTSRRAGYFFPPNEDPVHHEISHFAHRPHPEVDRPGAPAEVQRPVAQLPELQHLRPLHPRVRRHRARADLGRGRHDLREGHGRVLRQAGLRPLPRDGRRR